MVFFADVAKFINYWHPLKIKRDCHICAMNVFCFRIKASEGNIFIRHVPAHRINVQRREQITNRDI